MTDRTLTLSIHQSPSAKASLGLRIIEGYPRGKPVILGEGPLVIGREQGLGLCIDAGGISRRHAEIIRADGEYFIVDLESKNGTYVNRSPVKRAKLEPGDRIDIGGVTLLFNWLPASAEGTARERLSARELEVAELVGKGMTNVEIGRVLGISRRTVATHLANAYQRLGIHSRAALVERINRDDG